MLKHSTIPLGKVILAGAGCGDPELITVKAARFLQQADVVLTDRLVSKAILDTYVSKHATLLYVGKQCRRGKSTPQETINELLVEFATQGKLVVRLKGGDVSVFSNILDELQTLVKHGIPYEIVPGVSAAMGAAAYAGIPLTARGMSTAIRLLTSYKSDIVSDEYWKELAQTDDTLVFYMSSETLDDLVQKLTHFGIAPDKQLAVVEQATTPMQKVHTGSLYDVDWTNKRFLSPSLVIVGKVVGLQASFAWFTEGKQSGSYFPSIEVSVTQLKTLAHAG